MAHYDTNLRGFRGLTIPCYVLDTMLKPKKFAFLILRLGVVSSLVISVPFGTGNPLPHGPFTCGSCWLLIVF